MLLAVLLATGMLVSPAAQAAVGLDGVFHSPYGNDQLYAATQTERARRDPMSGQTVRINATTWPIAQEQKVWVTWAKNGVNQTPVGAQFGYNSGNNSYWTIDLGSIARGDQITYTVNANISIRILNWSVLHLDCPGGFHLG